ncbi:hypothetical protein E2C01_089282 [Portunus trituberculatus]|uniref:Uncharacterized protein n=1 Tax=Portunus trituberculatus TaxID=210409 RepID=A0A5B7JBH7_PORTR|nr:hypothetical protein [Portunus trituberculatus]
MRQGDRMHVHHHEEEWILESECSGLIVTTNTAGCTINSLRKRETEDTQHTRQQDHGRHNTYKRWQQVSRPEDTTTNAPL